MVGTCGLQVILSHAHLQGPVHARTPHSVFPHQKVISRNVPAQLAKLPSSANQVYVPLAFQDGVLRYDFIAVPRGLVKCNVSEKVGCWALNVAK